MNNIQQDRQIAAIVASVLEDGYCVLEDAVTEEMRNVLFCKINQIHTHELKSEHRETAFRGSASARIRNIFSRDVIFQDAAQLEIVNKVVEATLGVGYLLFASAINDVGPGEKAQRLHRDDILVQLARPFERPLIVNTVWALTEFTVENGATRFVPRSHLSAQSPPTDSVMVHATMKPGSILIYHGSLWHGSGANTTKENRRVGMIFTYCAGFIRPYENQLKLIPVESLRTMSERVRQLAGFEYVLDDRTKH